jgi:8-amino-7-oxononanoate synthase
MPSSWHDWAASELAAAHASGRYRRLRDFDGAVAGTLDARPLVSFASNDYLGLSRHHAVVAALAGAAERWGAGSGSARLIVGSRPEHSALERDIARWKGAQAALLFASGFAANLGVLTTFGHSGVTILSDESNHASIVDGCRLARASVSVFPHNDLERLSRLLSKRRPALVVSDSVFSMDGDLASVEELIGLCAQHDALLILDEAHAVLGPHPEVRREAPVLRVGTLSKFLGSAGGYVAGPRAFIELLINKARSFIFTTASPPADAAAARAALSIYRSREGRALRERLRTHIERVAPGHPSPIIPVVLGDEERALTASRALMERSLYVPAIRPPSVAPGSSRLRVTLSAAHTSAQVDELVDALTTLEDYDGAFTEPGSRNLSAEGIIGA